MHLRLYNIDTAGTAVRRTSVAQRTCSGNYRIEDPFKYCPDPCRGVFWVTGGRFPKGGRAPAQTMVMHVPKDRALEQELNKLTDLLLEEIALHEALGITLKTEVAEDGLMDGETLLNTQRKKNGHVRDIQGLEEKRLAVVAELAAGWAEPPAEMTLRKIIDRVP